MHGHFLFAPKLAIVAKRFNCQVLIKIRSQSQDKKQKTEVIVEEGKIHKNPEELPAYMLGSDRKSVEHLDCCRFPQDASLTSSRKRNI